MRETVASSYAYSSPAKPQGRSHAELPQPPIPARRLSAPRLTAALSRNVLETWPARAYRELTYHRRILGKDYFILSDPDDIEQVLVAHVDRYERDPIVRRLVEPWIGRGLVLADGEEWSRLRRTFSPAFTPGRVDRFVAALHEEARQAIEDWGATDSIAGAMFQNLRALLLRMAARLAFSLEQPARIAELVDMVAGSEQDAGWLTWRDHVAMAGLTTIPQSRGRRSLRRRWTRWAGRLIDQRPPLQDPGEVRDLLDLLRAARDPESGAAARRAEIVDQLGAVMMTAAFDITAALFWIAAMLGAFPEHQEAVREELCGDDTALPPDPERLRSGSAARAFVFESLRLFPPVYMLSRRARVDDRIGALEIPRGSAITIAPWLVHRHEKHWEEPLRFAPERFIRDHRVVVPKQWIPFGVGPKSCLGMTLALTEILVVLRVLLTSFRIELSRSQWPRPIGRATLMPEFEPSFELTRLSS